MLACAEEELSEGVVAALRAFLWPSALDTTRADHLVWLVKVPSFVSKTWKAGAYTRPLFS